MTEIAIVAGGIFVAALFLLRREPLGNIFPLTLLVTGLYYAVLSPIYWLEVQDGYFVGVNWSDAIERVVALFGVALLLYYGVFLMRTRSMAGEPNLPLVTPRRMGRANFAMISLGLLSCAFVVVTNSNRNALFLTAYQFSDLTVPALLYAYANNPRSRMIKVLCGLFVLFTIFVGFRYKLILFALPFWLIALRSAPPAAKPMYLVVPPVALVVLFGILTVTRVKFSGLDLNQFSQVNAEALLYGIFAEGNIIFGTAALLERVVDQGVQVGLQPVFDSVSELIPRFIWADRETGSQIWLVLSGLVTEQGYNSATTYPFFGEYLMMYGYAGMVIGVTLAGLFAAQVYRFLHRNAVNLRELWGGTALLAAVFAYYYISRGYMPQFVKSVLFVLLPYTYLVWTNRRRRRLQRSAWATS
jgi:hypothetical protein